jgi:hypothetical protein
VLFAAIPALLHDVLARRLAQAPDLVVTTASRRESLADAVRRTRANAVLTCSDDGALPDQCTPLLYNFPGLRVLVLTHDGRAALLYRLVLAQTRWTDVSPHDVLTALRHGDAAAEP